MAYVVSHFFEGGTKEQYHVVVDAAHPGGALRPGLSCGRTERRWVARAIGVGLEGWVRSIRARDARAHVDQCAGRPRRPSAGASCGGRQPRHCLNRDRREGCASGCRRTRRTDTLDLCLHPRSSSGGSLWRVLNERQRSSRPLPAGAATPWRLPPDFRAGPGSRLPAISDTEPRHYFA